MKSQAHAQNPYLKQMTKMMLFIEAGRRAFGLGFLISFHFIMHPGIQELSASQFLAQVLVGQFQSLVFFLQT
jgi:hypothetical protein